MKIFLSLWNQLSFGFHSYSRIELSISGQHIPTIELEGAQRYDNNAVDVNQYGYTDPNLFQAQNPTGQNLSDNTG